jgi:hypothetical protein
MGKMKQHVKPEKQNKNKIRTTVYKCENNARFVQKVKQYCAINGGCLTG